MNPPTVPVPCPLLLDLSAPRWEAGSVAIWPQHASPSQEKNDDDDDDIYYRPNGSSFPFPEEGVHFAVAIRSTSYSPVRAMPKASACDVNLSGS